MIEVELLSSGITYIEVDTVKKTDVEIVKDKKTDVEITTPTGAEVDVLGQIIQVGNYEHYKGDYIVTPKFENQKLKTGGLVMDYDVNVKSIPIEEVSNLSGGKTVIIGG